MAKTFDQSLIDTATIPMSMIDPEDMEDTTSEEFAGLRRVQQGCHSELSNREDFPFNKYSKTLKLSKDVDTYGTVEGRITLVKIAEDNNIYEVKYTDSISLLTEKSGRPIIYTTTFNPEKIKFYPTPDKSYNVGIECLNTKNVVLTDDSASYTIEVGSTLRMPEKFQHLYFDALEYYVLATNMRKQSNPRWQPTLEIFRQKWQTFLRGCTTVDNDTTFSI